MITGEQIRVILDGLSWSPDELAIVTGVSLRTLQAALGSNGKAGLTVAQEDEFRARLGRHGVLILPPKRSDLGVRFLPSKGPKAPAV